MGLGMSLFTPSRRAAAAAVTGVALALSPILLAGPGLGTAYAAVVDGAVLDISITEPSAAQNGNVHVPMNWQVPNGTKAGDTFTVTMGPSTLWDSIISGGYDLIDKATGSVVATAHVSGLTITFTMTAFAEDNIDVRGTARWTAKVAKDAPLGDQTATFDTPGKGFTEPITVTGGTALGDNAKQGGVEPDGPDADNLPDGMAWTIRSETATSNQTVHVVDTPVPGLTIDCTKITVRSGGAIQPASVVTACSPTQLVVDVPVRTGNYIQVFGLSPFPAGAVADDKFTNRMTLTVNGADHSDSVVVAYPDSGGNGTGDQFVEVAGTAKLDANHNGIQDGGDTALSGIQVRLSRTDGAAVLDYQGNPYPTTATTGADGGYLFTNLHTLPAGTQYTVTPVDSTVPAGLFPTVTGQGTRDTDYSTTSATSTDLTANGAKDATLDFGWWKPVPQLSVTKSDDQGHSGDDAGNPVDLGYAPGSANLRYTITNTGNEPVTGIDVTDVVDSNGTVTDPVCTWPGATGVLAVGANATCTGKLSNVLHTSMHKDTATATGEGQVSGSSATANDVFYAAAQKVPQITLGNRAWKDLNHNGIQDASDPGVPGVKLTATPVGGGASVTTTTGSDGFYTFTGLSGLVAYDVTVDNSTVPSGLYPTLTGQGTPETDSSTGTARSSVMTTDGAEDLSIDFGFWEPVSSVDIEKATAAGADADTTATAVNLGTAPGSTTLRIPVTNTGDDNLLNITVTDTADGTGMVTGLTCTWPDGSTGTTFAGPLAPGTSGACTATVAGVLPGPGHHDVVAVTATGALSHALVTDSDHFYATVTATPGIDVEKTTAGGADADTAATAINLGDAPGSTEIIVTARNTGDEPLTGIDITDVANSNGTVDALVCDWPGTAGDLPVGGSVTCTSTVRDVQPSATPHLDTAIATGRGLHSGNTVTDRDDLYATVTAAPAVTVIKKDAAGRDANTVGDAAPLGTAPAGTSLLYTITNTGNEPLIDLDLVDAVAANGSVDDLSCVWQDDTVGTTWHGPLAVGASVYCRATLTGVQAGPAHHDTATITATGQYSGQNVDDSDDYYATAMSQPAIDIEKSDVNGNDADTAVTAADLGMAPGSTGLRLTVTNKGDEPLTNVTVTDLAKANGAVTEPVCTWPDGSTGAVFHGQFAPGATATCTADLSNVQAVDAHQDTATVTATGIYSGATVIDQDDYWATVTAAEPAIDIEKIDTAGRDADTVDAAADLGPSPASTGLKLSVRNAGNEPLTVFDVRDISTGTGVTADLSCTWPDGTHGSLWSGTLPVGDSVACTADLAGVTDVSVHHDTATVTARGAHSDEPVTDSDDYYATASSALSPEIGIQKADTEGRDADTEAERAHLGRQPGSAALIYTVTNLGNETLTNVDLTDVASGSGQVDGLLCSWPDGTLSTPGKPTIWRGTFEPGQDFQCTASLSGVTADEFHHDVATVTATGVTTGTNVDADDAYWAFATDAPLPTWNPHLTITKTDKAGHDANTPGDAADLGAAPASTGLHYTVVNDGDDLIGHINVADVVKANGVVTNLSCVFPDGSTGTWWLGPMFPHQEFDCTATLTGVTDGAAHHDEATVTGNALGAGTTVTATDPYWAVASTPKPPVTHPAIDIEKVDVAGRDADTANTAASLGVEPASTGLTFRVRNVGDEPLTKVTVRDEILSGNGTISALDCALSGVLEPGATADCTATLTGVMSDSTHHDRATVMATGTINGGKVTASDDYWAKAESTPVPPKPSIDIEKADAAGRDADTKGDAADLGVEPGSTGLTFRVTNTGKAPLVDVTVTDTVIAGGNISKLDCAIPSPLAPGASGLCTADLTGVAADTIHHDRATVVASSWITGETATDRDDYWAKAVTRPVPPTPSIDIEKVDAAGRDADTKGDAADLGVEPGSTGLTFRVTNTGKAPLTKVIVTDDLLSGGTVSALDCTIPDVLAPGKSATCVATLTGVDADTVHQDRATVTAVSTLDGAEATDSDDYWATAQRKPVVPPKPHTPGVTIVKGDTAGHSADTASDAVNLVRLNGTTGLVFKATNTGDEPLTNVAIADKVKYGGTVTGLTCDWTPFGGTKSVFAFTGQWPADATVTCTAILAGVTPGIDHLDIAAITATGVNSGQTVTASNAFYAENKDDGSGDGGGGGSGDGGGGINTGLPGVTSNPYLDALGLTLIGAGVFGLIATRRRRTAGDQLR